MTTHMGPDVLFFFSGVHLFEAQLKIKKFARVLLTLSELLTLEGSHYVPIKLSLSFHTCEILLFLISLNRILVSFLLSLRFFLISPGFLIVISRRITSRWISTHNLPTETFF